MKAFFKNTCKSIFQTLAGFAAAAFVLLCSCEISEAQGVNNIQRFLGFHFDFHATLQDKNMGKSFDAAVVERFLTMVKPDYIQVDTKGVYGISSYPTEVGYNAGSFDKDVLMLFREITARHNVGLYAHYTGLMDEEAVKRNPSWARIKPDNTRDAAKVSVFSDYNRQILIPQLKELAGRYNLDGVWMDGDIWALEPDYSPESLRLFTQETGITQIPRDKSDRNYMRFIDFTRRHYKNFFRNYVNALHSYDSDFKITNNWAYSSFMPEPLEVDVDFLSGDLSSKDWISNAAFQSRTLASYGLPWDLMSWSFSDKGTKPLNLLLLEASEVMAMGGGFQSYWIQNRDGSINPAYFPVMKEIADFCRAREQYAYNSQIIPQVGVFFSNEAWKRQTNTVYNFSGSEGISGVVTMLLDGGNVVDIVMEHELEEKINNHPVMVVPEWEYISTANKNLLLNYARMGGKLLIMGSESVKGFENELGVTFEGENVFSEFSIESITGTKRFELPVQKTDVNTAEVIVEPVGSSFPLATINNYGRGKIAAIYYDAGEKYYLDDDSYIRSTANSVINVLYPDPLVKLTSPVKVHIVVSAKNDRQHIHLINVNGLKYREAAEYYNNLQSVQNVSLRLRSSFRPSAIVQQPEGISLSFDYSDGFITLNVPQVSIYSILEIQP